MLCDLCDDITLHVGPKDADVTIRRYSNLQELQSFAATCDFCALLHEEATTLEDPDVGEYCKQSWGAKLFNLVLSRSPILAAHRSHAGEHNVFISCSLDAQNTPGYLGGPTGLNWRSMLGGIYVAADSDLADVIAGRPFKRNLSAEEQILLGKALFDECNFNHDLCRDALDPEFMPDRVLDLQPDNLGTGIARLLICPDGFREPYATLSYCWGGKQNLRLTEESLHQFKNNGVRLNDMPATIQDACQICLGIGIRYIWICSLCILQDSETDWTKQSSAMATIFNCSDLTISAASSENCEAGILNIKPPRRIPHAEIAVQVPGRPRSTCYVRARLADHGFKEPTEHRGWTLQETLLSRRLLVRGTYQLKWQCAMCSWNQSGTVYVPSSGMKDVFPCPLLEYPLKFRSEHDMDIQLPPPSILDVWQDLVRNYCGRSLSLPKDKLPAISGLAKWLSNRHLIEDAYLAGLWKSQLPKCLLWYSNLGFPVDPSQATRPTTYRAPSWSWASLDSSAFEWHDASSESVTSTVLKSELFYKGSDTCGEVDGGYLDVQAPLQQGWLVPNGAYPEDFDFWDDTWSANLSDVRISPENKSIGRVYLDVYDLADVSLAGQIDRQDRVRLGKCLLITTNTGLLVREMNEDAMYSANQEYQRLGLVMFKENAATWWREAREEVIRLL